VIEPTIVAESAAAMDRTEMPLGRWLGRALLALAAAGVGYAARGERSPIDPGDGIEHAPDPIIQVDGLGRVTVFNRAAERMSGYDRSEVLRRHFTTLGILAIESYPVALKHFALAATGFNPVPAELTIHTKDGRAVVVEGNARARRVAGVMRSMQVVFRDTTERHQAQAALEAARDLAERERGQFLSLAESMSSGLLLADPSGEVAYCNPRLTEFTRVGPELTIGRPLGVLARAMSRRLSDPERFTGEFLEAQVTLDRHPAFDVEVIGDERRVYEITCFPVLGVWPEGPGFGSIVRDVTAERELDFRKTEFVGIASHELRTPLTGILGFSQLLSGHSGLDEQAHGWAARIADEAARLSSIADDLLNVSRIESGEPSLEVVELEVETLLDEVRGHFEARILESGHELVVRAESGQRVAGDAGKLREVLVNLVDNALKYSPDGGTVRVAATADGTVVRIAVSDEGIGIAEEELPRVFERFRRVAQRDTATIRGAGLGLYIVNSYVESMGGTVTVESEAGRSSTFTVTLPRVSVDQAA
jgi:PAS domain S-box-containing protein